MAETDDEPLVSVIVPVYNRESTVGFCIQSILDAGEQSVEVLCCDDGSTDSSANVIQEYVQKDFRVRYVKLAHKGVSAARNAGLIHARGTWITFCDSDDCVAHGAFAILKEPKRADLYLFQHGRLRCNGIRDAVSVPKKESGETWVSDACVAYIFDGYKPYVQPFYSVCGKFFFRKIIVENTIRFHEDCDLGEDQIFVCEYLLHTRSLCDSTFVAYYVSNKKGLFHLGSVLRSPENFLHNQKENYKALDLLYKTEGTMYVHEYAVNYMLDRPFTRILLRHLKARRYSFSAWHTLYAFAQREILPVWDSVFDTAVRVRNKDALRAYRLLHGGKKMRLYFLCVESAVVADIKKILSLPLRCLRYFLMLVVKK